MLTHIAFTLFHVAFMVTLLGLMLWGLPRLAFMATPALGRVLERLERSLEDAAPPPEPRLGGPFLRPTPRPPSSA